MPRLPQTIAILTLVLGGCDADVFEPIVHGAGQSEAPPTAFDVDLGEEHDLDLDADPCETHCRTYTNQCRDHFAYESYDQCETLCAYWDDGPGDEIDRAQCRIDGLDAVLAATTIDQHASACADIGPNSETCGSAFVLSCERYCDSYVPACVLHDGYFLNRASCMDWCGEMPLGTEGSVKDTIACRASWADQAVINPASFCDEAGPESHACG